MKSKIWALSLLHVVLYLHPFSAFAVDIPVNQLFVTLHEDCITGVISPLDINLPKQSDYQFKLTSQKPQRYDMNTFFGKSQNVNFQVTTDGTVTVSQVQSFLRGISTSIVLGKVDTSTLCTGPVPPNGMVQNDFPVTLQNVQLSQNVILGDQSCPLNGQIYSLPFSDALKIIDSNQNSITMSLNNVITFHDQASCLGFNVP